MYDSLYSKMGLPNLSIIYNSRWITLHGACPMHCRMLTDICDLCPLDASTPPLLSYK